MNHWDLRRDFVDIQRKGVGTLVKDLQRRHERFRRGVSALLALIDGDRLHEHVKDVNGEALSRDASDAELLGALYPDGLPTGVSVFILRDNTESLLRVVADCGAAHALPVAPEDLERKSINVRDRVLLRAAEAENRALRDCVLDKTPALADLVQTLVELVED